VNQLDEPRKRSTEFLEVRKYYINRNLEVGIVIASEEETS
jgi:hypothetical protein